MTVGHHRLDGDARRPFDPAPTLFDFVGDGFAPGVSAGRSPAAGRRG